MFPARKERARRRSSAQRVHGGVESTRTLTGIVPAAMAPSLRAAAYERSMIRPATVGPRSFTRTSTERPFWRFVTSTFVPSGSAGCAAVSRYMSYGSPLAVRRPWWRSPYHEASPVSTVPGGAGGRVLTGPRAVAHPVSVAVSATTAIHDAGTLTLINAGTSREDAATIRGSDRTTRDARRTTRVPCRRETSRG